MKRFNVTVNGVAYDVTVEEIGAGAAPADTTAEQNTKDKTRIKISVFFKSFIIHHLETFYEKSETLMT